jgi:hypothetical protein
MNEHMDEHMDERRYERMNGLIDKWMGECMDAWMD